MTGAGKSGAVGRKEWLAAAAVVRQRGQVAWALGSALEAAWAAEGPQDPVGVLEAIVARAVGGVAEVETVVAQVPGAGRAPQAATAAGEAGATWRQLQQTDLAEKAVVAVWLASVGAGERRATVALGLRSNGGKHVLGVWAGGAGEHRCSQHLAEDLRARGLGRGGMWLAVTEGERALDLALRQQWGERVVVAHCHKRVAAAVTGHLPAGLRDAAARALAAAWECPDLASAGQQLQALAESWRQEHPGAAARLLTECEATTVTQALGLRGALAQRLSTAVPARYLLEQCLPAARGRSGRDWVAAIAVAARDRQQSFRRLPEHAAIGALVQALAERIVAAK
jgi:hypothetical protein